MTSKNPAGSKRAAPPRTCDYTKAFLKDWERLSRSGRYDLKRLKKAMLLLIANDAPLGPEWLDHPLKGDWADHRECDIERLGAIDPFQRVSAETRKRSTDASVAIWRLPARCSHVGFHWHRSEPRFRFGHHLLQARIVADGIEIRIGLGMVQQPQ
jgi:mRNA interferase YafQ